MRWEPLTTRCVIDLKGTVRKQRLYEGTGGIFFMIISVFEAENERLYRVMESAASGVVSFDTGAGEIRQDYEA